MLSQFKEKNVRILGNAEQNWEVRHHKQVGLYNKHFNILVYFKQTVSESNPSSLSIYLLLYLTYAFIYLFICNHLAAGSQLENAE